MTWIGVLVCSVASTASAAPPEHRRFTLFKFQQPIGVEHDDITRDASGAEIRSAFSFTDRTSTVPLSGHLQLNADGAPLRYEAWGQTSRMTRISDTVAVTGKSLVITQDGTSRTVPAPRAFFVASAYAPVIMIEELLRYWSTHGKPAQLPAFPIGEIGIVRRGEDTIADALGEQRKLERFSITGVQWGQQIVWLDDKGRIAALKGVDAEFDHFEAVGALFDKALPALIARAAEDGLARFTETAAGLRQGDATARTAYVGGQLIDGASAQPIADAVVVTEGDRIVAAGPRSRVAPPAGARIVDTTGKTVLPGLWDMHAHFEQVEWGPVYLAAGVTTARDCGNELDFITAARDAVAAGRGVGPRLLLACIVDGEGKGSIGTERLETEAQIPALIAKFKKASCNQVKIYQSFPPRLIAPLTRAAHAAGMTVTGHVPYGIGLVAAVQAGYDNVEHLSAITRAFIAPGTDPAKRLDYIESNAGISALDLTSPATAKIAAILAAHKLVLDPTLALYEFGARTHDQLTQVEPGFAKLPPPLAKNYATLGGDPEQVPAASERYAKQLALIGYLHKRGVAIVAGTDQAVPGHSLHREIELLVDAGFTPMEAIQAATSVPARAMKLDKDVGTIAAGKRADLIVVDGDPIADIHAIRRIVTVVSAGTAYDPAKLWAAVGFTP